MSLIVQKFGGSSVANADRVRNVARIITETYRKGHNVVVVLSAQGDTRKFWTILEDRLEMCKESLMLRYDKLKDVTSDVSPIHWQYGAIARLKKGLEKLN